MARIPLATRGSLLARFGAAYTRRRFGRVLDPGAALANNPRVAWSYLRFEQKVAGWKSLDATTRALAQISAAAAIGCEWCLDFGYWVSVNEGVDRRKIEDVAAWRDSGAYDERERLVLEYAEAVTATPPAVTDELVAALRTRFDDAQLVELTSLVAVENYRSRVNSAFGLRAQGFRAECQVPATRS